MHRESEIKRIQAENFDFLTTMTLSGFDKYIPCNPSICKEQHMCIWLHSILQKTKVGWDFSLSNFVN